MTEEIRKWDPIEREIAFRKYSRRIEKVVCKMPDGRIDDYYILRDNPAVATLALTDDKKVILVKQFRPGPDEILLEMPGGVVEEGETPKDAAARELLEETGYAGKVSVVSAAFDDAYSTRIRHCAIAKDCRKIGAQKLDRNEFAEVVLVSLSEFRKILRSGKMTDVEIGYMALDSLGMFEWKEPLG